MTRINNLNNPDIAKNPEINYSKFYDKNGNLIKSLGDTKNSYIKYEYIPKTLIDALVSIEDLSFFEHDGFDVKRISSSLLNNLMGKNIEGASTITQQLSKNLFLTSEKTMTRKIDELLLSIKLENKYSKEEILEFYFNMVYFDPVVPGIVNACKKFFNKYPSVLTLSECATIVGLVKSPSNLNPLKYPDRADERKNVVLGCMLKNGYISLDEYKQAKNTLVKDIINTPPQNEAVNDYQAYIDCCYKEIQRLTNLDPYTVPLRVETYMDSNIQSYVDKISSGEEYKFIDNNQQIGLALIENETGNCIALSGGRNYVGEKLYNRAYDMRRGPASTIKPIFEYALAFEKLDYNSNTTLVDEETVYPNGESLHNAGDSYYGDLSLKEALGYSKNTTAIKTLVKLEEQLGDEYLSDYLKSINLMDDSEFTLSYGLGGMKYGVSPLNLASAYSMLSRGGIYVNPSLIKRIVSIDTGKTIYEDEKEGKRVLSDEAAFMTTDVLTNIVEEDYNGLGKVKINNVKIAAKTGTGAYDSNTISKFGYPKSADKDSWLCGYSKDYTLSVWSGFDMPIKGEKTYFGSNDKRRNTSKEIFKKIMEKINVKGRSFTIPQDIVQIDLVKYADGYFLPNGYIPSNFINKTYVKKGNEYDVYPFPILPDINPIVFTFDNKLSFYLEPLEEYEDKVYKKIYGSLGYFITINDNGNKTVNFITGQNFEYYCQDPSKVKYEIKSGYEKLTNIYGSSIINDSTILTPW